MEQHKKSSCLTLDKPKSGLSLFLREIATNPRNMGAACPSSNRLARTIASQVPVNSGNIVELGAGTGVITSALLEHGISTDQLLVVERATALAIYLRQRFPQLAIIQGDARELEHLLLKNQLPIGTVVSSLPLRSLPNTTVNLIGEQLEKVLRKDGLFIQFTYSLYSKPLPPSPHLQWIYSKYIWLNLPPARVDIFRHNS